MAVFWRGPVKVTLETSPFQLGKLERRGGEGMVGRVQACSAAPLSSLGAQSVWLGLWVQGLLAGLHGVLEPELATAAPPARRDRRARVRDPGWTSTHLEPGSRIFPFPAVDCFMGKRLRKGFFRSLSFVKK